MTMRSQIAPLVAPQTTPRRGAARRVELARAEGEEKPARDGLALARASERQRRRRLALLLAPTFGFVQLGFVALGFALPRLVRVSAAQRPLVDGFTLLSALAVLLYAGATLAARRDHARLAVALTLPAAAGTLFLPVALYLLTRGLDVFGLATLLTTVGFVLLTAALTQSARLILLATLLTNIGVVAALRFAPGAAGIDGATLAQMRALPLLALTTQWSAAGVLIATARTYRRALSELGASRVAYAQARQLDELKDEFLTNVNHELRNPVMALQGYVQLLLMAGDTLEPAERQTFLERAAAAGDQIATLVNDILDIRGLEREAGDFTREAVALAPAVEGAMGLIAPQSGGREIRVEVASALAVWGEPARVRQILTNLLSNAAKYSPAEAPILVRAWATAEGRVELTVRDYGLGIPPEQAPLLFHRFVRLPRDLASTTPGTGLGLYICRTLAEAMGGALWVESAGVPGQGSTFHLLLPQATV